MSSIILDVKNLSYRYDIRQPKWTLNGISFSVKKGEWLAVIGHNGSGKSTLAQILVGLLPFEEGELLIDSQQVKTEDKEKIRENIGIVFQNPENQFIGTTVEDDIAFGLENKNIPYKEMKQRVELALHMVEMDKYRYHDPSQLSGGQKQRVAIAGMLALQPTILILDEAFVMLDPKSRKELIHTIQRLKEKEGVTIISITHDMEEAAKADRVMMLEQGKVKTMDTPSELFFHDQTIEKPFAEKLRLELLEKKANVPNQFMTEDEMVQWICKLN